MPVKQTSPTEEQQKRDTFKRGDTIRVAGPAHLPFLFCFIVTKVENPTDNATFMYARLIEYHGKERWIFEVWDDGAINMYTVDRSGVFVDSHYVCDCESLEKL